MGKAFGGPLAQNKEKVLQASPVTQVSKDNPPFLIMHGDKDVRVPVSQSQLLAHALKRPGVDVTLKIVPGAGHGGPAFQTAEMRQLIQEFFDKHLKKATQKGSPRKGSRVGKADRPRRESAGRMPLGAGKPRRRRASPRKRL
jgi:acetyl esterase/lipase